MKVYSVSGSANYSNIQAVKNTVKPDSVARSCSNNHNQNMTFGNRKMLKLLSGLGITTLFFISPAAVGVAALSFFSGFLAYKLTNPITDSEKQNIAENGIYFMNDIVGDSFPY